MLRKLSADENTRLSHPNPHRRRHNIKYHVVLHVMLMFADPSF